jgi:hypothetical protein
MLKIIFVIIIFYIVIQQIIEDNNIQNNIQNTIDIKENKENKDYENFFEKRTIRRRKTDKEENIFDRNLQTRFQKRNLEVNDPWSNITFDSKSEYPYNYHIKINIPSLNMFQAWKDIIPNIEFSPKTKELIIPSKDEPSALAIANLISSNFAGQLSMEEIISKDLIEISISKAKSYEIVRNKLREQIMILKGENNSVKNENISSFENTQEETQLKCSRETKNQEEQPYEEIQPYEGNDYSYL